MNNKINWMGLIDEVLDQLDWYNLYSISRGLIESFFIHADCHTELDETTRRILRIPTKSNDVEFQLEIGFRAKIKQDIDDRVSLHLPISEENPNLDDSSWDENESESNTDEEYIILD